MQDHLHHVQENARSATHGEYTVGYKWEGIIVQMGDAHYQHLGDALSYKWGTRQPPSESTQFGTNYSVL